MDINTVYQFLVHLNPILLIIVGIIIIVARQFAKWIGIGAIILGIILIALPYLLTMI
ncbi:MAG: hypothetical protein WBF08_09830 [Candidatus Bathyarchaeia archaeon]